MLNLRKILCLGDIILDTYCKGLIERISPEAPIPVLKVIDDSKEHLGGSGNVARNITAAGGKCHLISVVGNDKNGKTLKKLCGDTKNLSFDLIIDKSRCTTKKQRFVSGNHQVLRVDTESSQDISKEIEKKIFNKFVSLLKQTNIVVISDYRKGMLTKNLLSKIIKTAKEKKKIVIVDPKNRDFGIYSNANIITPNLKELFEATDTKSLSSNLLIEKLSKKIINLYGFETVITTRSSDGISLVDNKSKSIHLPSKAKEVFDVSGAGDTVVSYIASGIAQKLDLINSVELANEAAGIAVSKFGTVAISIEEVEEKKNKASKICTLNQILREKKEKKYRRIGFTNGCFDLLHQGHIDYLKKSREMCDYLILALNSDSSIKKIKGVGRPILNQTERSIILSNFSFIDKIVLFHEKTPINLINKIKPQFLFKGDDYKINQVVGNKQLKKWGGKVILIKCTKGKSTTNIIERIKNGT